LKKVFNGVKMDHKKYKERIYLFLYDELEQKDKLEFQKHLEICSECSLEYNEQLKLKNLIFEKKIQAASDRLLNEARRELNAALRVADGKRSYVQTFSEKLFYFFPQPAKYALASLAFIAVGLLMGYLILNSSSKSLPIAAIQKEDEFSLTKDNIRINNIHLINKDVQNGEIEFTFDAVKPIKIKGNVNDRRIQSILTYSMLNENNPGLRLNSINAMNFNRPAKLDEDVKNALINVLMYDNNPGVRREAIKVLREYPYDEKIKRAYLYVLMNDKISGMRIEAMNSLLQAKKEGYKFDDRELSIFKNKMDNDNNDYIKYRARTVVEEKN
jgi:Putative zinc-finger